MVVVGETVVVVVGATLVTVVAGLAVVVVVEMGGSHGSRRHAPGAPMGWRGL